MNERLFVSESELHRQREFAARVRDLPDRPRTFHIVTMGCQMNERDSETIAGMLVEMGLRPENVREKADLILFNTAACAKTPRIAPWGNVIWLKELKKERPELLICVGGCMAQEEGMAERMKAMYPFNRSGVWHAQYASLARVSLSGCLRAGGRWWRCSKATGVIAEGLPQRRASAFSAFVNIMYGCNNFCSYCIVPYVRGRERSRERRPCWRSASASSIRACRRSRCWVKTSIPIAAAAASSRNSCGAWTPWACRGIRFMTSHPKDLSDELICAYGELAHLMPALHLPVQAGNDEILQAMNRRYTRAHYLELAKKLRSVKPDVGLTSDIIVGFPAKRRRSLKTRSRSCAKCATIPPSPSSIPGARAPRAAADAGSHERGGKDGAHPAPDRPANRGHPRDSCKSGGKAGNGAGRIRLARDPGWVGGKTPRGHMVNFPGKADLIGRFVRVEILSAGRNTLRGRQITEV